MTFELPTFVKKHRQLFPLLLLAAYCNEVVVAAVRGTVSLAGEIYNFQLQTEHYIAFAAVIINFLVYFFYRQFYKYCLAITLGLGLLNLLMFSALRTTSTLAINNFKITFQPAVCLSGLLAYFINFNRINEYLFRNLSSKTPEEAEREERELFEDQTQRFKKLYNHYSSEDLSAIISANKLVPAAIEAARQILNERQS